MEGEACNFGGKSRKKPHDANSNLKGGGQGFAWKWGKDSLQAEKNSREKGTFNKRLEKKRSASERFKEGQGRSIISPGEAVKGKKSPLAAKMSGGRPHPRGKTVRGGGEVLTKFGHRDHRGKKGGLGFGLGAMEETMKTTIDPIRKKKLIIEGRIGVQGGHR